MSVVTKAVLNKFKAIKVWYNNHEEYGKFYSNNETKPVTLFGLQGARVSVQTKGQKSDKVYTVWLNELKNELDEDQLVDEALYVHELGILAKDKAELELSILTLNKDRKKTEQYYIEY